MAEIVLQFSSAYGPDGSPANRFSDIGGTGKTFSVGGRYNPGLSLQLPPMKFRREECYRGGTE